MQLKAKTAMSNQQKGFLNAQIEGLLKQARRSELVTEEIKALPEGVNTYKATGRMYFGVFYLPVC